ncbi:hypothetical protein WJX84_011254 [Apatococcus fuscideae]|uniref:Ubiquitin-like domain-containing protein n=1 Tax=Apatococcus fuscideae TaxID=2026836 RepID=A0AAW1SQH2_9CHLO
MTEKGTVRLGLELDEGTQLQVDLLRHRITTPSDLWRYLQRVCKYKLLECKGHGLKRWASTQNAQDALGRYYTNRPSKDLEKPFRVLAVKTQGQAQSATSEDDWELFIEPSDQLQLQKLTQDDSLVPYASYPWLPFEYQLYNPDDQKLPGKAVDVYLRTLTGKRLTIKIHLAATIGHLKMLVEDKEGIPFDQQRLIFAGRPLEDGCTLASYGLTAGKTAHLVLRMHGGDTALMLNPRQLALINHITTTSIKAPVKMHPLSRLMPAGLQKHLTQTLDHFVLVQGPTLQRWQAQTTFSESFQKTYETPSCWPAHKAASHDNITSFDIIALPSPGHSLHSAWMLHLTIELFFKDLTGRNITIETNVDLTVKDLKVQVEHCTGVVPEEQRLIYAGQQWEGDRLLLDHGLKHLCTLHLVLRLRGGMFHDTSGRQDLEEVCSTASPARSIALKLH